MDVDEANPVAKVTRKKWVLRIHISLTVQAQVQGQPLPLSLSSSCVVVFKGEPPGYPGLFSQVESFTSLSLWDWFQKGSVEFRTEEPGVWVLFHEPKDDLLGLVKAMPCWGLHVLFDELPGFVVNVDLWDITENNLSHLHPFISEIVSWHTAFPSATWIFSFVSSHEFARICSYSSILKTVFTSFGASAWM